MKKLNVKQHVMTGISYMIPVVVVGGMLYALAKGLGGWDIGNKVSLENYTEVTDYWILFWGFVNILAATAMNFAVAVLTAGIAYSIAGRPGITPALIIGYISVQIKAGFLGGLLMGLVVGLLVNWIKKWKVPGWMQGLMPVLVIPVVTTFVCGTLFMLLLSPPIIALMNVLTDWIISLQGGSKFIIGAVIGACMGFDLGGPVNKTASAVANGLGVDGIYGPMSAKIVGGMTPPLGIGLAALIFAPKKFTKVERETAKTAVPMGLCFVTEGVLPFAANDPLRVIPSTMLGSAVAGGMAVMLGVESVAGHGGIFVVPMMTNPVMFLVALAVGSLVTGIVYAFLKKPISEEGYKEEEIIDLDLDINIG